jgi:hypothetical protein
MTDTKSKKDMEEAVKAAFSSRNVGPRYNKVGHDVVFRKGNPSDTHDLVRVAAHKVLKNKKKKKKTKEKVGNKCTKASSNHEQQHHSHQPTNLHPPKKRPRPCW